MESLFEHFAKLEKNRYDYYEHLPYRSALENPFLGVINDSSFTQFVKSYFDRGGKKEVFDEAVVELGKLRYPDHICSVFFLGISLYYKTDLYTKYRFVSKHQGKEQDMFAFLWFLIALYHDYAYQIENKCIPENVSNLDSAYAFYNITENRLYDTGQKRNGKVLFDARKAYFNYRFDQGKLDHGLIGGMLLYDRLLKIRRKRAGKITKGLYWTNALEKLYLKAADAISIHNIWLPQNVHAKKLYSEHDDLKKLINFSPVKSKTLPLFYILAIVDTLEPLKAFNCVKDKQYVLENLLIGFKSNSVVFANKKGSKLNFQLLINRTKNFEGWLEVNTVVTDDENSFEIHFR